MVKVRRRGRRRIDRKIDVACGQRFAEVGLDRLDLDPDRRRPLKKLRNRGREERVERIVDAGDAEDPVRVLRPKDRLVEEVLVAPEKIRHVCGERFRLGRGHQPRLRAKEELIPEGEAQFREHAARAPHGHAAGFGRFGERPRAHHHVEEVERIGFDVGTDHGWSPAAGVGDGRAPAAAVVFVVDLVGMVSEDSTGGIREAP